MAVDLGVFSRQKTLLDQQQLQQAFELKKQLTNAQLAGAVTQLQKAQYLDVDKLGEQALYKATMGAQLSPEETAAAKYVSAKTGGIQFDPVTGNQIQKPDIASKLGIDFGGGQQQLLQMDSAPYQSGGALGNMPPPMSVAGLPSLPPAGGDMGVNTGGTQSPNQFEQRFQEAMGAANGNPKLQQQIQAEYLKSKISPNEAESRNAGFAQRMTFDQPILNDPDKIKASASGWENFKADIPVVGNALVSDDYQSANQAQRDFINSLLRRESGAAISPGEFDNARKQYFPQYGDSDEVIKQKLANQQAALGGVETSAGPSYQKPTVTSPLQEAFDKKKAGNSSTKEPITITKPTKGKDGHMYISDPNRPGKYLKVD